MNKRGISLVVSLALIILIVVAAIVIIWVAVVPSIQESMVLESTEIRLSIDETNGYTYTDDNRNVICIQLKRGADEGVMVGAEVNFLIEGNTRKITIPESEIPGQNGARSSCFLLEGEFPTEVTVNPKIKVGQKEKVTSTTARIIPPYKTGNFPGGSQWNDVNCATDLCLNSCEGFDLSTCYNGCEETYDSCVDQCKIDWAITGASVGGPASYEDCVNICENDKLFCYSTCEGNC